MEVIMDKRILCLSTALATSLAILASASNLQAYGAGPDGSDARVAALQKQRNLPRPETSHVITTHPELAAPVNKLLNPVDLPGVPIIPGEAKFFAGSSQELPTETVYLAKYYINQAPDDAVSWYADALSMYKWKVAGKGHGTVVATNIYGDMVSVTLTKTAVPKYKSILAINLRAHNKK